MRKALTIVSLLFIMFIVFVEVFMPPIASKTVESRLETALRTDKVDASVRTTPAILMLFGRFDTMDVSAEHAMLGDVKFSSLSLKGRGVDMPVTGLEDGKIEVKSADELVITGVVTEADLADTLMRKVDKVREVKVTMTPQRISADGKAKLMGFTADVHLEGVLLEDSGCLYFRMTRLDLKNALLGRALTGDLFGDIMLADFRTMKLPVELDSVEQQTGQVTLTAKRK
ncbi:hypothetical protein [Schwartzia sp. (in: firmicutes)]